MTRRCFVSYVSTVRYIVGCFPVARSSSTNSFSFLPPIVPLSSLVLLQREGQGNSVAKHKLGRGISVLSYSFLLVGIGGAVTAIGLSYNLHTISGIKGFILLSQRQPLIDWPSTKIRDAGRRCGLSRVDTASLYSRVHKSPEQNLVTSVQWRLPCNSRLKIMWRKKASKSDLHRGPP